MKRIMYDVPRFSTYLHHEARDLPLAADSDSPALRWEDELFDRLYTGGEPTPLPEGERDKRLGDWAKRFHDEATKVPAFQRLAESSRGDALASAIATEHLSASLAPERQGPEQKPQGKPGQPGGNGKGSALARARQGGDGTDAMRRQILLATGKAERAVDEARETLAGIAGVGGWLPGSGPGEHAGEVNVEQVKALMKMLKQNPRLRQIAAMAGKMRRIAANKRRTKAQHAADEINDIEQGDDFGRMLPSELVKLRHPLLRLAFLRDVMERRALQYRLEGKETKGKGPVVVLVDKSGSMMGSPDTWATAVALAILSEAQREKRTFCLIPFDHQVMGTFTVKPGETLPEHTLFIPASGGTNIDQAMEAALDEIEKEPGLRKADVVLITDGGSDSSRAPALRERAKALNTTILGISIGLPASSLGAWADEAHGIVRLDTLDDAPAEALFGAKEEL